MGSAPSGSCSLGPQPRPRNGEREGESVGLWWGVLSEHCWSQGPWNWEKGHLWGDQIRQGLGVYGSM